MVIRTWKLLIISDHHILKRLSLFELRKKFAKASNFKFSYFNTNGGTLAE